MSLFLIHQSPSHAVILTDSYATKPHSGGTGSAPLVAPKLTLVRSGIYAAHAGTWQPAIAMLNELRALTTRARASNTYTGLAKKLPEIGRRIHSEFQKRLKQKELDVRIALVFTGSLRHPADVKAGYSTSIILWEAARKFELHHVRGRLFFGGSSHLSDLAHHIASHKTASAMLEASPLAAAQALRAIHATIAALSTTTSSEANVAIVGKASEHAVISGRIIELPFEALERG